eukprot:TRINITY_DN60935_c0_g1_i1.p1 TRINITY_DN60935_c0_g1~~TRINITY_DN60935_c0_g1_i1.p1  ORF type:complete len:189 (+),score=72.67 TRINITY_DN60935_c0_g1_i1:84-569(+)
MDASLTPLAVDSQMLMCLIANSVATAAVVLILDFVSRRHRSHEDDWRYEQLCRKVEEERQGWAEEKRAVLQRISELEARVREYQDQLMAQYRKQLIDHQERMDQRIESLRHDIIAARLSERELAQKHGRPLDASLARGSSPPSGSGTSHSQRPWRVSTGDE